MERERDFVYNEATSNHSSRQGNTACLFKFGNDLSKKIFLKYTSSIKMRLKFRKLEINDCAIW